LCQSGDYRHAFAITLAAKNNEKQNDQMCLIKQKVEPILKKSVEALLLQPGVVAAAVAPLADGQVST
jgi:hypothetical protein